MAAEHSKTIVVADDDQNIRDLLVRILKAEGYEVLTAEDGRQATALVRQRSCWALFTDLEMPDHEGIETIREVRRSYPTMHIVVVSGASAVDIRAAIMLGATVALHKPFSREEVLAVVRGLA